MILLGMCWYNWNPKSGLFPFCLWKKDFAKLSQVQLSTTRGVTFAPYGGEMNCGEFMLWLLPQADAWLLLPISTLTSWGWARAHPRLRQLAWSYGLLRVERLRFSEFSTDFWGFQNSHWFASEFNRFQENPPNINLLMFWRTCLMRNK